MSADHSAVDDRGGLVDLDLKLAKHICPRILRRPVGEPVVDGLPRAEAFRQVTPRNAGSGTKHDGFDEQAIAARGLAALRAPGEQRLQSAPLLVGKRVAVHI